MLVGWIVLLVIGFHLILFFGGDKEQNTNRGDGVKVYNHLEVNYVQAAVGFHSATLGCILSLVN